MEKLILFLDDDSDRHARFTNHFSFGPKMVWSAAECISELGKQNFDLVFLDHDLRGIHFDDPDNENSGSEVVRWIVAYKPTVKEFVVHSYNHVQAPKMVKNLIDAGYKASWKPFDY